MGAFADLWGTDELWCSFDMAHMKPPAKPPSWDGDGFVHAKRPANPHMHDASPPPAITGGISKLDFVRH